MYNCGDIDKVQPSQKTLAIDTNEMYKSRVNTVWVHHQPGRITSKGLAARRHFRIHSKTSAIWFPHANTAPEIINATNKLSANFISFYHTYVLLSHLAKQAAFNSRFVGIVPKVFRKF